MMDGIDTKGRDLDETLSRLITAYHILHAHHVLDEHGHIAVRNPHDSNTFFTARVSTNNGNVLISRATSFDFGDESRGTDDIEGVTPKRRLGL
jgi:hypothetical protein